MKMQNYIKNKDNFETKEKTIMIKRDAKTLDESMWGFAEYKAFIDIYREEDLLNKERERKLEELIDKLGLKRNHLSKPRLKMLIAEILMTDKVKSYEEKMEKAEVESLKLESTLDEERKTKDLVGELILNTDMTNRWTLPDPEGIKNNLEHYEAGEEFASLDILSALWLGWHDIGFSIYLYEKVQKHYSYTDMETGEYLRKNFKILYNLYSNYAKREGQKAGEFVTIGLPDVIEIVQETSLHDLTRITDILMNNYIFEFADDHKVYTYNEISRQYEVLDKMAVQRMYGNLERSRRPYKLHHINNYLPASTTTSTNLEANIVSHNRGVSIENLVEMDSLGKEYINLSNGMYSVKQKKLFSHDPKYLSTIRHPIKYDKQAKAPKFREYMEMITGKNKGKEKFIQEWLGYMFSAKDISQQKALLIYGGPGTGKSTLLSVVTAVLGKKNISNVPLQKLGDGRFEAFNLVNKLANIQADLSSKTLSRDTVSIFKNVVGGDSILVEEKGVQGFEYKPHCKFVFAMNKLPNTSDVDLAFFDRLLILPLDVRFRGTENEDKDLLSKLTSEGELSGIFNWAMEGLRRLIKNGRFTIPMEMQALIDEYSYDNDPMARFIEEYLIITEDYNDRIAKSELLDYYNELFPNQRLTVNSFNRELKSKLGDDVDKNKDGKEIRTKSARYFGRMKIKEKTLFVV